MTSLVNWSWWVKCILILIFIPFLTRRHQLIDSYREEVPFLRVSLGGRGWWIFFIYVKNYAGCWLEFHCPALPIGLVVSIKLFYWCCLLEDAIRSCLLSIQGVTTLIFMPCLSGEVNPMLAIWGCNEINLSHWWLLQWITWLWNNAV